MTQKKLNELQGIGRAIITWVGILGFGATLVLGWDQIGRNKEADVVQNEKIQANSDYVIEDRIHKDQLQKSMDTVMADVKELLAR